MVGVFFLSVAVIGYLVGELHALRRIGLGLGGSLLIDPHLLTDLIGAGLIFACLLGEVKYFIRKRANFNFHKEIPYLL